MSISTYGARGMSRSPRLAVTTSTSTPPVSKSPVTVPTAAPVTVTTGSPSRSAQ